MDWRRDRLGAGAVLLPPVNIISWFGCMDGDLITGAINADIAVIITVPEHCFAALVKVADGMGVRRHFRRETPSVAGERWCQPQNRIARPRALAACDPPRQGDPPMRRSTAGQTVEGIRGERAGVLPNDRCGGTASY
jgi:hypothetical protein